MATSPKKPTNPTDAFASLMPTYENFAKMAEQFKMPGIDVNKLVDWQRKDLEALTEANRQAYEGMKALAERRNEILQESLAQWQEALKDASGKDMLTKQTEVAQRSMQQAFDNFRELAEMEARTRSDAWKVLQDRMQENMANLQQLLQPKK